ncbi:hypothetical protein, partial [Simiduia litorea]
MRIVLILSIFLASCSAQESVLPSTERSCNFTAQQQKSAWSNVTAQLIERYPDHAKFCETNVPASSKVFEVVNGECRVYLACAQTVEGHSLLH